jgi:hypothetical protein
VLARTTLTSNPQTKTHNPNTNPDATPQPQPNTPPNSFTGGGAKNLDIRSLSADLTRATLEIPFSIPSYFALVARALGILEGIALSGDPDYRVVLGA